MAVVGVLAVSAGVAIINMISGDVPETTPTNGLCSDSGVTPPT